MNRVSRYYFCVVGQAPMWMLYDVVLPSGAGANVDAFAAKLIKKYGPDILRETAKLHFKNTEKALALARKL